MAALIVWYLLEEEHDAYEIVVGVPIVLSLLLADSLFVSMLWKNDEIVQTVECLNEIVEQREFLGILAVVFRRNECFLYNSDRCLVRLIAKRN